MHIKNDIISFIINECERIDVFLPEPLDLSDGIFRYDIVKVYYIKDAAERYVIYRNDFIMEFVDVLNRALKRLLTRDKILDTCYTQDIGYLWNKHLRKVSKKNSNLLPYDWDGCTYKLWDLSVTASWLYEKDGNFIFEITPQYEWYFRKPKEREKARYITYIEFMGHYKPCVITQISRETATEWLQQTEEIIALMNLYDDKYLIRT